MPSSIEPSTVAVSSGRGDDGDGKAVASDFGHFRSGETLMVWVLVCWRRRVDPLQFVDFGLPSWSEILRIDSLLAQCPSWPRSWLLGGQCVLLPFEGWT
jgi:hypothetical protein